MPLYNQFTNTDSPYTNPSSVEKKIQLGATPFWEVSFVLGDLEKETSGGNSGSGGGGSNFSPGEFFGGGGLVLDDGCPHENEFVWISKEKSIRAKALIGAEGLHLYNPISGNVNKIVSVKLIEDVELVQIITKRGMVSTVSKSHKIISNTADRKGTFLTDYKGELVVGAMPNIYIDEIELLTEKGRGNVVEISLDTEFIYMTSNNRQSGILAHNLKDRDLVS